MKKTLTKVTLKENTKGRAEAIMNYRQFSDNDKQKQPPEVFCKKRYS